MVGIKVGVDVDVKAVLIDWCLSISSAMLLVAVSISL